MPSDPGGDTYGDTCAQCGGEVGDDPVKRVGEPEIFCSSECSQSYWGSTDDEPADDDENSGGNTDEDGGDSDDGDTDGQEYVCGAETETTDGPCQMPVSGPDERCHSHPADGSGPPEGHGSGTTEHSMGNGRIHERLSDNAKPNLQHGVYAVQDDPHGTLNWVEDNDPEGHDWILSKWESYLIDAPFPADSAKADDLLHACLMMYVVRAGRAHQVEMGLTQMETLTDEGDVVIGPDGDPVQIEQEWAGNLPVNRIAREARSTLKDLGVLDDPESQKAEAMGWSQAAKEIAVEADTHDSDATGGDV